MPDPGVLEGAIRRLGTGETSRDRSLWEALVELAYSLGPPLNSDELEARGFRNVDEAISDLMKAWTDYCRETRYPDPETTAASTRSGRTAFSSPCTEEWSRLWAC